jgi:uncharacterized protein
MVKLTWDAARRDEILTETGLDLADAGEIFAAVRFEGPGEDPQLPGDALVSAGFLGGCMVVVAWVERDGGRHILSMRRANEREHKHFGDRLGAIGRP